MPNLPTLVLVHGSWHQASCFNPITKLLQGKHGVKCIAVSLPSTSGNPEATFKDDIDVTQKAIASETSAGRDVVVIAHSYGGMVGNSAIKGFAKPRDAAAPTPTTGHVIGLILIASGCNLPGLAFMDPFFGHPPPSWRVNKETGYAELVVPPRKLFYHDVPADEAEYWVSQLTTQSLKALFEGGEFSYPGWKDVPVWYIGTIEDRGLPVVAQRLGIGMARAMGGVIEHREMQTSHSPFLSQPVETVGIILEAVEAFTGRPVVEDTPTSKPQIKGVTAPAVRLWQPLTWYRFGLPLAFGRLVGGGFLLFGWCWSLFRSK
ncbi:Alpha/beta hydrolase family-domain-containing protein [Parachaetomium inaequale]|uniref:Alpha/beta hydrolase family-domain-containing protein n=1 Tax=Parachaetomium inaequale TaxID=2588326 RepID=A0AAN6P840_9PEZI|nr:Alpha/beta hydrolase family-domain-containing protein [Parachaetomium inaequale]